MLRDWAKLLYFCSSFVLKGSWTLRQTRPLVWENRESLVYILSLSFCILSFILFLGSYDLPSPHHHSLSLPSQNNLQFGYNLRDILTTLAPVLIISVNKKKKINIHIPGRLGFGTEDLCSYIIYLAYILCLRDWKRKGHDKAQNTIWLCFFLHIPRFHSRMAVRRTYSDFPFFMLNYNLKKQSPDTENLNISFPNPDTNKISFFLIWESPLPTLEKEMTTHSSILAWRIPWAEESGGLQSMRLQESDVT